MGDPDVHNHINMPIVIAGGPANGKGAQWVKNAQPTPLANVHLTLLERMGVREEKFGDSTSMVSEIRKLA